MKGSISTKGVFVNNNLFMRKKGLFLKNAHLDKVCFWESFEKISNC